MSAPLKWEEILPFIDYEAIRLAVMKRDTTRKMFVSTDDAVALKMVDRALRKWASRDVFTMKIRGIESHFTMNDSAGKPLAHGLIDLDMVLCQEWKTLTPAMIGETFVLDWKTSGGGLDSVWVDRLRRSWQWKLYSSATKAKYMIYRGIGTTEGEREYIMEIPQIENLTEVVRHQFEGYRASLLLHNSRATPDHPSWNRHMPYACGAYARTCGHINECETNSAPFIDIPIDVLEKPFSYSSGERLTLCAELQRRYIAAREGLDTNTASIDNVDAETEETLRGGAVHRGLEEAYKQLKKLQEQGIL